MQYLTYLKSLMKFFLMSIIIFICIFSKESYSQEGTIKWSTQFYNTSYAQAVGEDGTIYVANDDGQIFAFNQDGTTKWMYRMYKKTGCPPTLEKDGTLYIWGFSEEYINNDGGQAQFGYLFAINPDGSLKWKYYMGRNKKGNIALGNDGTIYTGIGILHAFDPSGNLKWTYGDVDSSSVITHPVVGKNGIIYFLSKYKNNFGEPEGFYFIALNPDGNLKSKIKFFGGSSVLHPLIIGLNEKIYFYASNGNTIYAVNPDGSWEATQIKSDLSDTVIGNDGIFYCKVFYGFFSAVNPDGTLKWQYQPPPVMGGYSYKTPAIGKDGVIYLASSSYEPNMDILCAINPDGTLKWKYEFPGETVILSPTISHDGTLFMMSVTSSIYVPALKRCTLYAFQTSSYGYQKDAPWPCYGHDNGHTFNAGTVYTSVEDNSSENTPSEFVLSHNYPNPFNPSTTISYSLPMSGHVTLNVYSISGQKVATLVNGFVDAGKHEVVFDGSELASGVYLYRFEAGGFSKSGRMLLMK